MSKENEDRLLKIFKEELTEWGELRSLFRDVFDASQTTHHILIDGFDEVPRNERDIFFSTLGTINSFSRAKVKVFLSSRHEIRNEVGMAFKNYWKELQAARSYTQTSQHMSMLALTKRSLRASLPSGILISCQR